MSLNHSKVQREIASYRNKILKMQRLAVEVERIKEESEDMFVAKVVEGDGASDESYLTPSQMAILLEEE